MTASALALAPWSDSRPVAATRLTSRGRAVLLSLSSVLALVVAVLWLLSTAVVAPSTAAAAGDGAAVLDSATGAPLADDGPVRVHVVQPGDTLWDLAASISPAADPRPTVDRIQRLNAMSGSDLTVGRQLWLPLGDDGR